MSDLPIGEGKPGRKFRFPFDRLVIGKCFIVKGMKKNILGPYKSYAERALARRFKTETLPDNAGIAVWRIG
uniref:Uncharacterized protein n=1 Tax=viral metagenome TaxID=1070528 RepID=A0A6M3JTP5_9ZZZZ